MKSFLVVLISLFFINLSAQKLYHPDADAEKDIQTAIETAKIEGKNVVIQLGGNWCSWCILFDKYINKDKEIKAIKETNFVYYHLNFSKENKAILDKYGNPEKLGFPALFVLDAEGKLLHTQETSVLEEGKGYNKEKVLAFFNKWTPLREIK